jgi:biopolymer transport protein ExbD
MAGAAMEDEDGINAINVTPLVDIMLVLLIIFMVASAYIVKEAIEVDLPKAATATQAVETTLSVVMDKHKAIYLNGSPSTIARLATACRQAAAKDKNTQAIFAADHSVTHGDVIELIDLVRRNGLERFALNVKRQKTGTGTFTGEKEP